MLAGSVKSPLRYPGGKSRLAREIVSYFPSAIDQMASPFIGGGSVELLAAGNGVKVMASDSMVGLVNFWQQILANPREVARICHTHIQAPMGKDRYAEMKREYQTLTCDITRASYFFTINRCSYSGLTFSGGYSIAGGRFTKSSIDRLAEFGNLNIQVKCADYRDALAEHHDKFLIRLL